jgi:Protein  of unknown function (DUF3018)
MTAPAKTQDSAAKNRQKTRDWRARMRARGLRPIQIWVPDTRAPGFAEEAARQALMAAQSQHEAGLQAFVDEISRDIWKE